jgi:hypothetical protein
MKTDLQNIPDSKHRGIHAYHARKIYEADDAAWRHDMLQNSSRGK